MSQAPDTLSAATPPSGEARLTRRLVEMLMHSRGLDGYGMDRICGFQKGCFSAMRGKDFPYESVRNKIERALGCRIFCDEQTWAMRQLCFARHGLDPAIVTKPELLNLTRTLDLKHRLSSKPTRADLLKAIYQHFAANPRS